MKLQRLDATLRVKGLGNLSGSRARSALGEIVANLSPELETVEIDLSRTKIVDGYGLGALMSLYQEAQELRRPRGIAIRLLNPSTPVQQLLELTRMRQFFKIQTPMEHHNELEAMLAARSPSPTSAENVEVREVSGADGTLASLTNTPRPDALPSETRGNLLSPTDDLPLPIQNTEIQQIQE
jgi:anti-anti-sigma regulatory factor